MPECSIETRIKWARAALSRAKGELLRLSEQDPTATSLLSQLQKLQNEFATKYKSKNSMYKWKEKFIKEKQK